MTKALVVGSGGLTGAYSAGVLAELCRHLGPNHFDSIYASSVGVFAATFFVANQPDTIEYTWRNLVDGRKLVNFGNALRKHPVLDLGYLIRAFQEKSSWLDVPSVFASPTRLIYVATEYHSGRPRYIRPTPERIFEQMTASCAVPLAHHPIKIEGELLVDGALSDSLPATYAINHGHDQIVVVNNKPKGAPVGRYFHFSKLILPLLPAHARKLFKSHATRNQEIERRLEHEDSKLIVIRPSQSLPIRHFLDTRKRNLEKTVRIGNKDAAHAAHRIRAHH